MPIYEYFCPKCGSEFELRRHLSEVDKPALCPRCGTEGQKLMSAFASKVGFAIKGPDKGAFRKPISEKKAKGKGKRG